jgi:hypothetical protein
MHTDRLQCLPKERVEKQTVQQCCEFLLTAFSCDASQRIQQGIPNTLGARFVAACRSLHTPQHCSPHQRTPVAAHSTGPQDYAASQTNALHTASSSSMPTMCTCMLACCCCSAYHSCPLHSRSAQLCQLRPWLAKPARQVISHSSPNPPRCSLTKHPSRSAYAVPRPPSTACTACHFGTLPADHLGSHLLTRAYLQQCIHPALQVAAAIKPRA